MGGRGAVLRATSPGRLRSAMGCSRRGRVRLIERPPQRVLGICSSVRQMVDVIAKTLALIRPLSWPNSHRERPVVLQKQSTHGVTVGARTLDVLMRRARGNSYEITPRARPLVVRLRIFH